MGKNASFYGFIKVVNMNRICIGANSRFISGFGNFVGGAEKIALLAGQEGQILIGNNVGISNATIVSQSSIQIDDYVFIGGGTKIYDNDFHAIDETDRLGKNTNVASSPIWIKQKAFIGAHSIILKGVTIGKNSIVGAGSVVTKDIPDNEIWGGAPAKKIRDL